MFSVSVTGTGSHPVAQTRNVYIAFPHLCYLIHHPVPVGDIFSLVCLFAQPLLPVTLIWMAPLSLLFLSSLPSTDYLQGRNNIILFYVVNSTHQTEIIISWSGSIILEFRGLLLVQGKALLLLPVHSAINGFWVPLRNNILGTCQVLLLADFSGCFSFAEFEFHYVALAGLDLVCRPGWLWTCGNLLPLPLQS